MRLPAVPVTAQAAVAAALIASSLTMAPPALAVGDAIYGAAGEFTKAREIEGGYRGSTPGQDKQFAAGAGKGAETAENSKIQGGGASTLQGGRRITITRGVNLDNTNWKGEDLRGVAFQQSVVRSANFEVAETGFRPRAPLYSAHAPGCLQTLLDAVSHFHPGRESQDCLVLRC